MYDFLIPLLHYSRSHLSWSNSFSREGNEPVPLAAIASALFLTVFQFPLLIFEYTRFSFRSACSNLEVTAMSSKSFASTHSRESHRTVQLCVSTNRLAAIAVCAPSRWLCSKVNPLSNGFPKTCFTSQLILSTLSHKDGRLSTERRSLRSPRTYFPTGTNSIHIT